MFSTLGDIQYIRVFSTFGEYHEYIGDLQYIGGYHEYIGGCSVHRRDTMSTLGREGYNEYIGGYHDACGGIP